MRKIFYTLAILILATTVAKAQSSVLWGNANGEITAAFDTWNASKTVPFGWYYTVDAGHGSQAGEAVADRDGNPDKAFKMTTTGVKGWTTWHSNMRTIGYASESAKPEYTLLNIPEGTSFYYKFWAKSDTEGTKLYIGVSDLYNPDWVAMPYVELTTEWKQYEVKVDGSKVTKNLNNTTFNIHFRESSTFYIDDLDLRITDASVGIGKEAEDNNPISITQSDKGISFTCHGGLVEIYNAIGKMVYRQNVNAGITNAPVTDKGLYIVKLSKNGKISTVKTIVK